MFGSQGGAVVNTVDFLVYFSIAFWALFLDRKLCEKMSLNPAAGEMI